MKINLIERTLKNEDDEEFTIFETTRFGYRLRVWLDKDYEIDDDGYLDYDPNNATLKTNENGYMILFINSPKRNGKPKGNGKPKDKEVTNDDIPF